MDKTQQHKADIVEGRLTAVDKSEVLFGLYQVMVDWGTGPKDIFGEFYRTANQEWFFFLGKEHCAVAQQDLESLVRIVKKL